MTLARPKRKAAGNKNYLDAIPEAILEEVVEKPPAPVKGTKGKRANGAGPSKSASPGSVTPKPLSTGKVPFNWQPPVTRADLFSNKLNLTDAYVDMKWQVLTCPQQSPEPNFSTEDDEFRHLSNLIAKLKGLKPERKSRNRQTLPLFQLRKGDYIYMVSEPLGEPYYVGRIMGFKRKVKLEEAEPNDIEDAAKCVFEIQWFYRPRDISKNTRDSRLLFASMHSDTCPLSSYRGMAVVKHRLDVETYYVPPPNQSQYTTAIEFYSSFPNCFYFDKLFDRYMIKFYDIIKTSTLLEYVDNKANNSQNYLLALNKRFEFVFMEGSRTKQFINNFHSTSSSHCDICAEWCSLSDSVSCGGCSKHFHMLCLDPPLLKKPSRGFSWSCAACTKKHEIEHRSKKILMLSHDNRTTNEQELLEFTESVSPKEEESQLRKSPDAILPKYERMAIEFLKNDEEISVEKRRLLEEWSLRYLGLHTRLEDAVDLDDRSPYPRACTNLGAKYQALNIPEYEDHPIVYYDVEKSATNKTKKGPGGRKVVKKNAIEEELKKLPIPKEFEDVPTKEFPQWLQPRPKGYIERGVDDGEGETCTLIWKSREEDKQDDFQKLDSYIASCSPIAESLNILANSPNFMDAIVKFYMEKDGNSDEALKLAQKLTRDSLKEPTLSKEEIKRFEAGVKKYGSELYPTYKEVKTQPCAMVVRYYYLWKKTPKGRQIWGNFPGRKRKSHKDGKSEMKIMPAVDEFADSDDDSAYENEKIIKHKKLFRCKHCKSYQSQYWHKITGYDGTTKYDESALADDIDPDTVTALCCRCAKLWRRYAVYWEDPYEVERKNARGIGGYKKKVESELVSDAERILKFAETEGGGLSYEVDKLKSFSSVLLPSKAALNSAGNSTFFTRTEMPATPTHSKQRKTTRAPAKTAKAAPRSTSQSKEPPLPVRLTSRQLSLSSNKAEKSEVKEQAPASVGTTRKRKAPENGTAKVKTEKDEKVQPAPKKPKLAASAKAKATKASKNTTKTPSAEPATAKKKRKAESEVESKANVAKTQDKTAPKPAAAKRQKRVGLESTIANPILNASYRSELPRIATIAKIDKRLFPNWNQGVLEEIVRGFKLRQLTDMKLIALAIPLPSGTVVDLPFPPSERDCSICLTQDARAESLQEMLICGNCGVNVHASCAGLSVSGKQKPIKQWLCETCLNDLSPHFSSSYSCCVCLAHETHRELAILGSPKARPDYLVPVIENGKWCHLLCALFTHNQTTFRSLTTPAFVSKEIIAANNAKPMAAAVESITGVLIENFSSQCGICKTVNGAMAQCDLCENDQKYHITCAQDTPAFKLGFKLTPQTAPKATGMSFVDELRGKLSPVLLCPNHQLEPSVFEMRKLGRRTQNGELKPVINLFIEDLVKASASRITGPQLRAHNYVTMMEKFMALETNKTAGAQVQDHSKKSPTCTVCSVLSSPKWWPNEGKPGFRCQSCFRLDETKYEVTEGEGDVLAKELNEPLCGEHYGIKNPSDHIMSVYNPSSD